jgi:dihydroneopterin aldolase
MPLTIYIRDLIIAGRHGVHEHEKDSPQRFNVSVGLEMAESRAPLSDDLADTVDWSQIRQSIIGIVEGKTYDLMERLAMEIAAKILEDKRIARATVTIDKIDAFESGIPSVRLAVDQAA